MGVLGAPDFVERHVFSTWGACSLELWWVPRGPERGFSDPTECGIPLRSFSFLRSLFSLQGNWEKVGPAALHRQTGIPAKPRPGTGGGRQREARVRARGECGPSSAEGVPSGTGAVDALRWTLTVASFPLARKSVPTLHMHTPAESAQCTRTTVHAARHDTYTVICTCVACVAVALCRHVYA